MPSDACVLAFDTSAAHCAAALLWRGQWHDHTEAMARGQAERLTPMLEELMARVGAEWADITALGVGVGPGNFTGIRMSVALARGLSVSLGVPAVGVSGLEALALDQPRPVTAVIPAPRGQVYGQTFRAEGAGPAALQPGSDVASGTVVAAEHPGAIRPLYPLAQAIGRLALERAQGDTPRPAPLYLRKPDAAPARDAPPPLLP